MELRGRLVFEMMGVLWTPRRGAFLGSLPLHARLDFRAEEADEMLKEASVPGLCFPSFDRPGLPGGLYVVRPATYDLRSVARTQRGQVERGLETCRIERLGWKELLPIGMAINENALTRQGRRDPDLLDPVRWRRLVEAVGQCPWMDIHGAFVDGQLGSYLISCREGEWLHLLYKISRTSSRHSFVDHALDYSVIREAAGDGGIQFIGNGYTPILPLEGVDRYKRQMGYQVEPHQLCIHVHPKVAPMARASLTSKLAAALCATFPHNNWLAYRKQILEGVRLSRGADPD